MKRLLPALLVLVAATGCGAGRSLYFVWDAERAFREAEEQGAATQAVYEYTLAREYLVKAREEQGYSDYRDAEKLARSSSEWAARAVEVAQYGTTERELMLREIGNEVPEDVVPEEREMMTPLFEGATEEK